MSDKPRPAPQAPQTVRGLFLSPELREQVLEILDELPRKRVNYVCSLLESLNPIEAIFKPQGGPNDNA